MTLNGANHMLTNKNDAFDAANIVVNWDMRYIPKPDKRDLKTDRQVVARLGDSGYTTENRAWRHGMTVDESEVLGGNDFGPSPYQILCTSLSVCTVMTLQMYARRKKWPLLEVQCYVNYSKEYSEDCQSWESDDAKLDTFDRTIELEGELDQVQKNRLMEIADKCPVHRTLSSEIRILTSLRESINS